MVDLHGGEYLALNDVGGRMWDSLVSGKTPEQVAADLAPEYDAHVVEILDDCVRLADELLERGLLVRR
jgi:hypothetical protein